MKKRRSWSDDEKREICQQAMPPGVSVAQVARRYAMNANMIYTWLKDPRFAPLVGEPEDTVEDAFFIEVAMTSPELPVAVDVTPPSACFNTAMICASLFRPFFIVNLLRYLAEKILLLNTTNFLGGDYPINSNQTQSALITSDQILVNLKYSSRLV